MRNVLIVELFKINWHIKTFKRGVDKICHKVSIDEPKHYETLPDKVLILYVP